MFGRNWLNEIKLDRSFIHFVFDTNQIDSLLKKYRDVFKEGCGSFSDAPVTLHLNSQISPKYIKARQVPYALRQKVIEEMDRLESEGIIEPVQFLEWATPCVPVIKSDKSILLCGDYSKMANTALKHEPYPIPRIKDLFARLSGGQKFSKIDLSQAYQQLRLTAESRACTTVNTIKGLYQYTRLL